MLHKRTRFSLSWLTNYFKWVINTIQGRYDIPIRRYYGLTSFIISIIILACSFKNLFDTLLNFLANAFMSAPSGTTLEEFGTNTVSYLGSFRHEGLASGLFLVTISFVILISLSWLFYHQIMKYDVTIRHYINYLATITNGALPLELIGLILAMIGHGFKLVVFLDLIAVLIYQMGTIDELWQAHFHSHQTRLYTSAILLILYPVAFLIILYVLIIASK